MPASHDLELFNQMFLAGQFAESLALLDSMILTSPDDAALHWHRANCLEKLERYDEIPEALNRFLNKEADHVPAILKRVEYSHFWLERIAPYPEDPEEEGLSSRERKARLQAQEIRDRAARELDERNESDLRGILARNPDQAQAMFLLSSVLRSRQAEGEDAVSTHTEAGTWLNRAIELAPENPEYRAARAEGWRAEALVIPDEGKDQALDPGIIRTFSGLCYRRDRLESALNDYHVCWQASHEPRYALRQASLLHDLGRYAEALERYDEALETMPADDPRRALIVEQRARSENHGAGEREQMAQLLLNSIKEESGRNRTQQEDIAAQAILGAAEAIRSGVSISEAIADNISDDPDTMMAMNIARQILNTAREPLPGLEAVDAREYPGYQRAHADRVEREALQLGLQKIADAEARGMFQMLGQRVLIKVFRNQEGDIGMAAFSMKPKWPGLLGFLILLFTGKWKVQKMVECVTHFDDGSLISTQPESISAFEFGGQVKILKVSANASVADILQEHVKAVAEYRATHATVHPMIALDLAGVESRWVAGQKAKAAYREWIGYITDAELIKLLGSHYERFVEKVKAQIRKMATG